MKRVPYEEASHIAAMNLPQTYRALLKLVQQEMADVAHAIVARHRHQPAHVDEVGIEAPQLSLNGCRIARSLRSKMSVCAQRLDKAQKRRLNRMTHAMASRPAATYRQMAIEETADQSLVNIPPPDVSLRHPMSEMGNASEVYADRADGIAFVPQ
jgi:hypothetical protein